MAPILFAAALFAVGCTNQEQATSAAPSPQYKIVTPTPELDKNPAPEQQEAASAGAGQDEKQHRHVEDRLFQLDDLAVAKVKVKDQTFNLWVMDTSRKREEGMMFLKDSDYKADEGMIFVFLQEQPLRFWMQNTLVDLDIAYIDKNGKMLNGYTMKALDTTTDYSSKGAGKYVIELKPGTLKKYGIQAGDKWIIPATVVAQN
ncbi:MAG: DUF192 domain-containing protein [Fimbriimonadaceae bacterium]|nr:DUF192 domain-containing protein [Fimbriimonadaceae bacterium]QYK54899.1 MAG: DUF192 domain-containing protein [Fimbriimonadaceae bacterium]